MGMSPTLMRPRNSFTPKSIAGLQLWLDGADSSTVTIGTGVSVWADKSGLARNATQTTANNQPAYSSALKNGRNALTFNGSNSSMITGSFAVAQPYTFFVVGKLNSTAANQNFIDGGISGRCAVYFSTLNQWGMYSTSASTGGTPDTNWHVFSATFNGATSSLRIDGSVVISGNPGSAGFDGVRIGGYTDTLALLNGAIGEITLYASALPTTSLKAIERYAGAKWGITVA